MFTAYTYLADMLERLAGFNGQWVGWSMMAFGAIGLIGNWAGGRLADRSALGATLLFSALMAAGLAVLGRSEEHTSELQSLMRISYAVLCWKKQTDDKHRHHYHTTH